MNEDIKYPYVTKELVEYLEEHFDIRQRVKYEHSRDALLATQELVEHIRAIYDKQEEKED